jgi:hypothetical protein
MLSQTDEYGMHSGPPIMFSTLPHTQLAHCNVLQDETYSNCIHDAEPFSHATPCRAESVCSDDCSYSGCMCGDDFRQVLGRQLIEVKTSLCYTLTDELDRSF